MNEMILKKAKIIEHDCIAPDIFSLKIDTGIFLSPQVGQFIMVYLDRGELLLPRPISICDAEEEIIEIVYQVVGKGTLALSKMKKKQDIKILAPLGKGFDLPQNPKDSGIVAVVGGGIGVPPLYYTAKKLVNMGFKVHAYLGFRTAPILAEKFRDLKDCLVSVATEDGSLGHHGFITDAIDFKNISNIKACGPEPMLREITKLSYENNIPCQVSMEQRMACGIGTCVGCVIKIKEQYTRVCCQGPVFDALEVFPQ